MPSLSAIVSAKTTDKGVLTVTLPRKLVDSICQLDKMTSIMF